MIQGNYESPNMYWWKLDEEKIHESVFSKVNHLEDSQSHRSSDNLRHMKLYGNYEALGLHHYNQARVETSYNSNHRVTLNVVKNMIDTVVSKITKNRPKATFLTDGGDWSMQSKAKKLTKFVEGQFQSCKFYETASMAFQDACIFGTGAIKIYKDDKTIKAERVFIDEIIIDDAESYYSEPRQLHQKKYVHKDVLKEMFPEHKGHIDAANSNEKFYGSHANQDMILVVESWHLPSGKDADDGLHAICIDNKTLFSEEYKKNYFPFVFIRWGKRPVGFFGVGLSEELAGIQLEINKILKTIQISMHLTSIPKVFVEASSKVVTAHLNNKIGGVIKYVGTKPSYESVSAVPQDLFMHLDRLYNRAFEIAGVSQLSAQSSKPSGLDSGRALREFSDIESERFQYVSRRYQESFIEAAEIFVDLARDLYNEKGELTVKVKGDKFLETINWKDVDMEEDKYMLSVFPTSSLSSTPSGRLQDVQELIQAGMIEPKEGLKLLDFPDLESYLNRTNAALEDIERMIELMIDKGEYQSPEPYQDLQTGIKMMQQAYLLYRTQNAPEERLDLFRRWIEDANELIVRAATPEQPIVPEQVPEQAIDPTMEPQAVPEAPPQSELLPNVPQG